MTLVTLLGKLYIITKKKKSEKDRERKEKCAELYNSIWASN